MKEMIESVNIKKLIYEIRGKQVMLDSDLARLYHCKNGTKSVNLAVKRNVERFPEDFYFQLTIEEFNRICGFNMKPQNNKIRSLPYVFTEQGVAMLATMLVIRHKTKHKRFMIGIPVIIVLQAVLVALAMYARAFLNFLA